ncbi:MAG: DUF3106 domain-containing protein [Luteimonas sp.]
MCLDRRARAVGLLLTMAAMVVVVHAQSLPSALQSRMAALPAVQRGELLQHQAVWNIWTTEQRQAFVQRVAAWDALLPPARAQRRDAWQAWMALPPTERARLQVAADAYAALPPDRQSALRQTFDALDASDRRGWLLGPTLGRDYPHLQSLLAQVPVDERTPLLTALRAMTPAERGDLAVLAQRTPPQDRDAMRRALLSSSNRGVWLRERLDR